MHSINVNCFINNLNICEKIYEIFNTAIAGLSLGNFSVNLDNPAKIFHLRRGGNCGYMARIDSQTMKNHQKNKFSLSCVRN